MKQLMLAAVIATLFTFNALADDLTQLQGKWSLKKTNNDGQSITQTLEIKTNSFVFQILRDNGSTAIYAEGHVKLEKSAPFSVVKFTDINGGESKDMMQPIDDDHISVYVLDEDKWTLAANFDKDRDGQKPNLEVYTRTTK